MNCVAARSGFPPAHPTRGLVVNECPAHRCNVCVYHCCIFVHSEYPYLQIHRDCFLLPHSVFAFHCVISLYVCVRVSFFMGGVLCDAHNLSALQPVIALYCLYVLFPQFLATPRCSLVRLSLPVEICIVVASCVRVNVFTFSGMWFSGGQAAWGHDSPPHILAPVMHRMLVLLLSVFSFWPPSERIRIAYHRRRRIVWTWGQM